ncbi:MAG: MerR family transcriptional regulator [Chitinophagaceae bacterium]|nr:MerR family transcriptional regulator [Chitinophagaceae bacterium]
MPKKRGRKPKDPTLVIKKEPGKRGRKSLKEAAAAADLVTIPEDEILFRKQYYTMGEVAEMFQINHSLIRLWESQFPILQPKKNKKGDRYFRPSDIKNLYLIHNLIRLKKYTIEGAKAYLKNATNAGAKFEVIQSLQKIRNFLLEIQANL